jgi:tellurite resistance protein TehA-like permease
MSTEPAQESVASRIAELHPAYFAMVMATGIISVALELRGMPAIALPLVWLNVLTYAVLWLLTLIRIVRFPGRVRADLFDHNRSVGFFTLVAGTCVLGNQFVVVVDFPRIAVVLWLAGIVLWAVITYSVFTVLTVKSEKPSLAEGINGAWLVAVVAAQAVSVLGGLLAPQFAAARELVIYFALIMWLGGAMLYIWIIVLIFYRYTFMPLDPRQLAPPYWINMGAMAISTLAGTVLVERAGYSRLLTDLLPFVKGLTLLYWATATWWIPLLLALGAWRHIVRKVPLAYDVVYWSAVFPLGMYTACTHRLAQAVEQPWLDVVPRYFVYVALAAWCVTLAGLVRRAFRGPIGPSIANEPGRPKGVRS